MTIAILYICTGRYNQFFPAFYKSSEDFFLKGIAEKEYFVFTDDMKLTNAANVHLEYHECQGFPADSLFRFKMFMSIQEQLKKFDYIYFFNSNAEFKAPVGEQILPHPAELVAAAWPYKCWLKRLPMFFPYERNKKSLAYIAPYQHHYIYYMGGLNGGTARQYLSMVAELDRNIRDDYEHGIIASVHDESHINRYLRSHPCKILLKEYCWPEEWKHDFKPKIIFRDKVKADKYFDKGRKHNLPAQLDKGCKMIWSVLRWYLRF